jgi:Ni,Fe-hydrogenase III large subunit
MNHSQILAASQADLKRRMAELIDCFNHGECDRGRMNEAAMISRELARRVGCVG